MSVRLDPGDPALLLPPAARLLHLGLPKTGTTALQHRAAAQRPALREQGVLYPGTRPNHRREGLAFAGRAPGWSRPGTVPHHEAWRALQAEVRAAPTTRVWLSHENFAEMSPVKLRELVQQVGGPHPSPGVHAVLTLRSLPALLTSAWSQYLKSGLALDLDDWAARVLADPPDPATTPNFRRRTDLGGIARRCADAFGADRVTLVVLDPADRDLVPRAFESLLGLSAGTLTGGEPAGSAANRSFTVAEAELLRSLNERLQPRDRMSWSDYHRYVFTGAVDRMLERTPGRDEPRLTPPAWAVERAAELAARHRHVIEQLDVRVVGDLAGLSAPVPAREGPAPQAELPVGVARDALQAVVELATARPARRAAPGPPPAGTPSLAAVPAGTLARTLLLRAAVRARRSAAGARRRAGGTP